jgi:lysophospholipase L1-like esterase
MLTFDSPWLAKGETLVCFGDSITASGVYTGMLQAALKKYKIKVINSGVGGDKTPSALTRLKKDVTDHKPDAVSVYLGTNDSAVGRHQWADEPTVHPVAYKTNLIWIIHLCKLAGIKKFSVATPAWRFYGPAAFFQGDIMRGYCLMAREAADETESRLVPLDAAFEAAHSGNGAGFFSPDGVHMTEKGARLIADTMLSAWSMSAK